MVAREYSKYHKDKRLTILKLPESEERAHDTSQGISLSIHRAENSLVAILAMDPVSAAASCITIIQLLGTAKSLFNTSQHALKNINSITTEINSLKVILEDLEDQEYKSIRLVQMMIRCESDLNALREKLEKINGSSDRKRRWKWLLVKEDVVEALERIRGMRGNLLLAMTTSNW